MAVAIVLSLATACLLLIQAAHILKNGETQMFFLQSRGAQESVHLRGSTKVTGALMYGIPACVVFCILAVAAAKNGLSVILRWIVADIGNLFGGIILFIAGLFALLRPDVVLRWAAAAHPDVETKLDNRFGKVLTRALGAFLSGFGLLILALI